MMFALTTFVALSERGIFAADNEVEVANLRFSEDSGAPIVHATLKSNKWYLCLMLVHSYG